MSLRTSSLARRFFRLAAVAEVTRLSYFLSLPCDGGLGESPGGCWPLPLDAESPPALLPSFEPYAPPPYLRRRIVDETRRPGMRMVGVSIAVARIAGIDATRGPDMRVLRVSVTPAGEAADDGSRSTVTVTVKLPVLSQKE